MEAIIPFFPESSISSVSSSTPVSSLPNLTPNHSKKPTKASTPSQGRSPLSHSHTKSAIQHQPAENHSIGKVLSIRHLSTLTFGGTAETAIESSSCSNN